jgi:site-specific DNA-cytosine methylase
MKTGCREQQLIFVFQVLSAMDINNNATSCYKLNHMSMEKDVINTDINAAPWEQTSGNCAARKL